MIFLASMALFAFAGFGATVKELINFEYAPFDIFVKGMDLVTICVPPILPTAMTFGTAYSLSRLRKLKIFCISPPRINVSGRVSMMVFDKTGTLTEDGL
jgi:P-type E1-E2 ATPase